MNTCRPRKHISPSPFLNTQKIYVNTWEIHEYVGNLINTWKIYAKLIKLTISVLFIYSGYTYTYATHRCSTAIIIVHTHMYACSHLLHRTHTHQTQTHMYIHTYTHNTFHYASYSLGLSIFISTPGIAFPELPSR